MKRFLIIGILGLVSISIFLGCSNAGAGVVKTVTISNVGWLFENEVAGTTNASVDFWIHFDENNLITDDLASITASAQGKIWTWGPGEETIEDEGYIKLGLISSSSPHTIPLTGWTFTVELKNGNSSTYNKSFPAPGTSTVDESKTFAYTEDYGGDTTNMVQMLNRGSITVASFDNTTLTVTYTVTDSNIVNGYLWLFGSTDTYIGRANSPVSWDASQTVDTDIIPAGVFYTDGTPTTMEIEISDFTDSSATLDFADVAKVVLILTDGSQYTDDFAYDFRSRSLLTVVP